jgi:hypothetical protein
MPSETQVFPAPGARTANHSAATTSIGTAISQNRTPAGSGKGDSRRPRLTRNPRRAIAQISDRVDGATGGD